MSRPPKIPAILLAAGASRRLGEPKQLVEIEGEPLIHRAARVALEVCDPVMVVMGCQAEAVRSALRDLPVTCLTNLEWEEGMASSLRTGVSALPLDAPATLFLVCDQPAVNADVLRRILDTHAIHPDRIVASSYAQARGIPALFPRRCLDDLLRLRGDRGARSLLSGDDVLEVPFPGGEEDLDQPEHLSRYRSQ